MGALDREEHRQLAVGVVVRDAGGMSATQVVSVVIDDVNDNRMRPAAKTVYLWKTQVSAGSVALPKVGLNLLNTTAAHFLFDIALASRGSHIPTLWAI